jgi:hypothetical protein
MIRRTLPVHAALFLALLLSLPVVSAAETDAQAPSGAAEEPPDVRLRVEADRTAITIGDPILLTARLTYPETTRIVSFAPERILGTLNLLDAEDVGVRRLEDGKLEDVRLFRITSFETGEKEIPPLEVTYVDTSGVEGTVSSGPIRIAIASVLTEEDTEPADINPPATMPERPLWPWIVLAAALLAAAGWLLWRRRRAGRGVREAAPPAPLRPAHEVAYSELERLLSADLLEKGRIKEFYIELAEIIRRYLGARFAIETVERTTHEVLEGLKGVRAGTRTIVTTGEFLLACDLVKFAKHLPEPEESRRVVERAYRLVDETRPPETVAAIVEPAA